VRPRFRTTALSSTCVDFRLRKYSRFCKPLPGDLMITKLVLWLGVSLPFCLLAAIPGAAQTVTLTPNSIGFAAQGVGTTSVAQTVTVKNTSTKTLILNGITVSGDFSTTTTCGSSLAAAATCTVSASFSPGGVGSIDGAITFLDNASPNTQVVNLTGKGVSPVSLSTTTLQFPRTTIGSNSAAKNVTLTNSATALTMSSVSVSGDYSISANTCTGTIAASKTCSISVTFAPTMSGSINGALTVKDSASGSPQIIALSGTGTGTVTNPVSLSPPALSCGNQPTGSASGSQTVTLTNSGSTALAIGTVGASGDFAETDTCAGKSIPGSGGTCTIKVNFAPTAVGTIAGAITVTDAAVTSPQVVSLTGTGVSALVLSPASLTFTGQVGVTGTAQTATLTNNSSSAIAINKVAVSGDYTQSNTCAGSVPANSSCKFSVTFVPLVAGTIDGALTVTTAGSSFPQVLSIAGTSRAIIARYAYALEYSAFTPGLVVAYSVNPVTGALRTLETVQLPSDNYGIVVHPSNRLLYIPDGSQILAYGIAANGLLQPVAGSPFNSPGGSALKFTPNGKFAYTNTGVAYSVNVASGVLTQIGTASVGNLPFDVALAPSGNFLYIPNFHDDTISGFAVNQTTGGLTAISGSPFASGDTGPTAVVVSPNGKYLFAANASASNVGSNSVFSIDSTTGGLTPITGSPFPGSGAGNGVTIDPTGHFLYVASTGIDAYSINQSTGALVAVAGSPYAIPATANGVTVDPSGKFLYAAIFGDLTTAQTSPDVITYSINTSTGALSRIGSQGVDGNQGESVAISTGPAAVAYTPRFVYATNLASHNISEYTISSTTGALTAVSGSPLGDSNDPQLIAATPSGAFVYTANANHTISEYSVNSGTGALTLVSGSPITGFGNVTGLVVDPTSSFLLVLDATKQLLSSYTIDPSTGTLTFFASSPTPNTTSQTVALDPTGAVAVVTSLTAVDCYQVNNGSLAPLKASTGSNFPVAVAVDQSSQYAFVAESSGNAVVTYNLRFGGVLSSATTGNNPRAVVAEPSGKYVYVANVGDGTVSAYSLNLTTGALTQIGSAFPSGSGTDALSTSNDGKHLYAVNNAAGTISIFTINSNGTLSSAGSASTGASPTSLVTTGTIK
jgi:6-phosphogluconolactonase (cycloisomerase 2 family)